MGTSSLFTAFTAPPRKIPRHFCSSLSPLVESTAAAKGTELVSAQDENIPKDLSALYEDKLVTRTGPNQFCKPPYEDNSTRLISDRVTPLFGDGERMSEEERVPVRVERRRVLRRAPPGPHMTVTDDNGIRVYLRLRPESKLGQVCGSGGWG